MVIPLLAEISDKMPSILELWVWHGVISFPLLIGIARKWIAILMLLLALALSTYLALAAYREAFLEPGFSSAVQAEMGNWWIANSIASSLAPMITATAILVWHLTSKITHANSPA